MKARLNAETFYVPVPVPAKRKPRVVCSSTADDHIDASRCSYCGETVFAGSPRHNDCDAAAAFDRDNRGAEFGLDFGSLRFDGGSN